jgi:hypothetical protein
MRRTLAADFLLGRNGKGIASVSHPPSARPVPLRFVGSSLRAISYPN